MPLAIDLLAHNKPVETHTASLNTPVLVNHPSLYPNHKNQTYQKQS